MSSDDAGALIKHIESLAEEDADHTTPLLGFLEHADPAVREAAAWALWSGKLDAILEPFLRHAESDPDEGVRAASVSILGRFVYEGLMLEPADEEKEIARSIRRVRAWLSELLNDPSRPELLRRRALESLSFDADPELQDMIEEWSRSDDELFRKSAAFAMGRVDSERFSRLLLKSLDDPSQMVQIEAIRSLGELGYKKALPRLTAFTRGPDEELALEAILALGQIGGARAEAALKALKKSSKPKLAEAAKEALEDLEEEED